MTLKGTCHPGLSRWLQYKYKGPWRWKGRQKMSLATMNSTEDGKRSLVQKSVSLQNLQL